MFDRFSVQAKAALESAWQRAARAGRTQVEPEDLLSSLVEDGDSSFCGLLERFSIEPQQVLGGASHAQAHADRRMPEGGAQVLFSRAARRVLEYAVEEADRLEHERVGTSHFLLALLREAQEHSGGVGTLFEHGLDLERVRAQLRRRGGGDAEAIPALLFFELDARARREQARLEEQIKRLEQRFHVLNESHETLLRRFEALARWVRSSAASARDPLREG